VLATKKILKEELNQALKPDVSAYMIDTMADQSISLQKLQQALTDGGRKVAEFILKESVNGKARVTAKPKIVDAFVDAVQKSLSQNVDMES